ncbi:hypothetical protein EYF80_043112 [Liparis tanakae]|uniref:Uncharacterized protein n=1 Tax=Liparis tanakae TaxID=230148 RepID=A0A4Z2G1I2_9TELE|nr:hypothetical protein EYF80_043112 [Liparis tanakae]
MALRHTPSFRSFNQSAAMSIRPAKAPGGGWKKKGRREKQSMRVTSRGDNGHVRVFVWLSLEDHFSEQHKPFDALTHAQRPEGPKACRYERPPPKAERKADC